MPPPAVAVPREELPGAAQAHLAAVQAPPAAPSQAAALAKLPQARLGAAAPSIRAAQAHQAAGLADNKPLRQAGTWPASSVAEVAHGAEPLAHADVPGVDWRIPWLHAKSVATFGKDVQLAGQA